MEITNKTPERKLRELPDGCYKAKVCGQVFELENGERYLIDSQDGIQDAPLRSYIVQDGICLAATVESTEMKQVKPAMLDADAGDIIDRITKSIKFVSENRSYYGSAYVGSVPPEEGHVVYRGDISELPDGRYVGILYGNYFELENGDCYGTSFELSRKREYLDQYLTYDVCGGTVREVDRASL